MSDQFRAVEAPAFFEKLFPDKPVYWTCYGNRKRRTLWQWLRRQRDVTSCTCWTVLHYSKDDAEAWSVSNNVTDGWEWDREPASEISLDEAMFETRCLGRQGVKIVAYVGGGWRVIRRYPANEPVSFEV